MLKLFQAIPMYFVLFFGCSLYGSRAAIVLRSMLRCIWNYDVGPGLVYSLLFGVSAAMFAASFRTFFSQDKYLLGTSLMYGAVLMCYPAICWRHVLRCGLHGGQWLTDFSLVFAVFAVLLVLHFAVQFVRQKCVARVEALTKEEMEKELEVKND